MDDTMIIGIDEAGRGPWAGPIVAVAVRLNEAIEGLNDSKQLSEARRARLRKAINTNAHVGIGWVQPRYIDAHGLTAATSFAMQQAIQQLPQSQKVRIIIDGAYNYLPSFAGVETVVKADAKFPAVSAASIVAKEARDAFMKQMDHVYPQHQFSRHKGYGTALHGEVLKQFGVTPMHRRSFKPIAKLL